MIDRLIQMQLLCQSINRYLEVGIKTSADAEQLKQLISELDAFYKTDWLPAYSSSFNSKELARLNAHIHHPYESILSQDTLYNLLNDAQHLYDTARKDLNL